MGLFGCSFLSFVSTLFFTLFGFMNRVFFNRFVKDDERKDSNYSTEEAKPDFEGMDRNKKDSSELFFKFKFQTKAYEELGTINREGMNNAVSSSNVNKYEFIPKKDFRGFMEKTEDMVFSVNELNSDSFNSSSMDKGLVGNDDLIEEKSKVESVDGETENSVLKTEDSVLKTEQEEEISVKKVGFLSESDFFAIDSDVESNSSRHDYMNCYMDSESSDGFLSDHDFNDGFLSDHDFKEEQQQMDVEGEVESNGEKFDLEETTHLVGNHELDEKEDGEIMEELEKSESLPLGNKFKQERNGGKDKAPDYESRNNSSSSSLSWDFEDSNGLESLWEHQDLIEQLKMELKKVKATGLPTILEESESPNVMENLRPWKIDEKVYNEDRFSELHKFYKSYRERMRKFDILNYQKMYAIGFLQSKDPLQSISSNKSSSSLLTITSLLSQNFRLTKRKKSDLDPMMKFVRELNTDLEIVYVGQLCLSWEIIHWQYEKALELWESDPYGVHHYNEVAGEFQQLQVLMQRFIENEPFEGPRVQNYVKNRCLLRNLLQVPLIREDTTEDKKKTRRKRIDNNSITSQMLVETMEESIRIFWRFIRADKDANSTIQKSRKGTRIEPQEPTDLQLVTEVKSVLQKKEKKLRDILRSGNCILRKFQKHNEEETCDQVLYFFSQVDMKLVARVLNMSKVTTEQLVWCQNKLSKINFVSRKIHVEPSFLLFPC